MENGNVTLLPKISAMQIFGEAEEKLEVLNQKQFVNSFAEITRKLMEVPKLNVNQI